MSPDKYNSFETVIRSADGFSQCYCIRRSGTNVHELPVPQVVSPKSASQALGVSESSLKRWCDQGLLRSTRTAGGHRKLAVSEIANFARTHGWTIGAPELLGLPPRAQHRRHDLGDSCNRLADALLAGDELMVRQIVFDHIATTSSLAGLFDDVVAAAFQRIGERWACREAEVFQERRACETMSRMLFELRQIQPAPWTNLSALGGTMEGDQYSLPMKMAEVVLREQGFHATAIGTSVPVDSLVVAIEQSKPRIFWVSISHIADEASFFSDFRKLTHACERHGTCLVVGGRALTPERRRLMSYSAFCDTMRHLEQYARTMVPTLRIKKTPHRRVAKR